MQKFTTANIEHLCGVNSATLYLWERRYQLCFADENSKGRRYYSKDQLKNILVIATLFYSGFSLPALAVMSEKDRETLVWQEAEIESEDALKCKLALAAVGFEPIKVTRALQLATAKKGVDDGFLKIIYPLLRTFREGLKTKPVYAAIDPFLSLLVSAELISQTSNLPPPPAKSNSVVLFGEGEGDPLLLQLINYLFKKGGQSTLYFGPTVKWQTIKPATEAASVSTIYVHLFEHPSPLTVDEYLESICQAFPEKNIVASGGPVLIAQRHFKNLLILKSDAEIVAFAKGATSAAHM